jgi:hypothetical protein
MSCTGGNAITLGKNDCLWHLSEVVGLTYDVSSWG